MTTLETLNLISQQLGEIINSPAPRVKAEDIKEELDALILEITPRDVPAADPAAVMDGSLSPEVPVTAEAPVEE